MVAIADVCPQNVVRHQHRTWKHGTAAASFVLCSRKISDKTMHNVSAELVGADVSLADD